jgi:seryl-tRNA synthetase
LVTFNMDTMALVKADQFHHENLTWERLIDFLKQENSFLKNRLAQVLDHDGPLVEQFVAVAEQFQNQFISKDGFFDELKHDIHEQELKLTQAGVERDSIVSKKIIKQQEKLRNEMIYLEKDFTRLKNEFNDYLLTVNWP